MQPPGRSIARRLDEAERRVLRVPQNAFANMRTHRRAMRESLSQLHEQCVPRLAVDRPNSGLLESGKHTLVPDVDGLELK